MCCLLDTIVGDHQIDTPQMKKEGSPSIQLQIMYLLKIYPSLSRLSIKHYSPAIFPNSVEEVLSDPKWVQAMQEELKALKKNNTWKLVPLTEGKKNSGM